MLFGVVSTTLLFVIDNQCCLVLFQLRKHSRNTIMEQPCSLLLTWLFHLVNKLLHATLMQAESDNAAKTFL